MRMMRAASEGSCFRSSVTSEASVDGLLTRIPSATSRRGAPGNSLAALMISASVTRLTVRIFRSSAQSDDGEWLFRTRTDQADGPKKKRKRRKGDRLFSRPKRHDF